MRALQRLLGVACVVGACALALSSCSSSPTIQYGGGNGGGSSATTTTTAVVPTIGTEYSPTYVAAKFVETNWSTDPSWPSANYVYTLDRPYLTRTMIVDDAQIASRPQPASVKSHWALDAKYDIEQRAIVSSSWVVTDAGVTSTSCVVEVDFSLVTTSNGAVSSSAGTAYEYAFKMQKTNDRWLVASQPQEPQ
jgi:hypothetical protein